MFEVYEVFFVRGIGGDCGGYFVMVLGVLGVSGEVIFIVVDVFFEDFELVFVNVIVSFDIIISCVRYVYEIRV